MDDDPLVSINTSNMLVDLGHSVSEAPSGAQALQLLETDLQFDVVVTDYERTRSRNENKTNQAQVAERSHQWICRIAAT